MQNIFNYPEFLENNRINDADIAHAYDSLPSSKRAHIKNGIAFNHFLHKERASQAQSSINDSSKGYMYSVNTEPVPWTVLFFTPTYLSAPRMIATLMPALLAKVPLVLAISLNGLASSNALTSLELMGIEDIFCLNNNNEQTDAAFKVAKVDITDRIDITDRTDTRLETVQAETSLTLEQTDIALEYNEALKIIQHLQDFKQNGRILFLHNGELNNLVQAVLEQDLMFWQENKPPKIAVQTGLTYPKEYLAWAHPDALCSDFKLNALNNEHHHDHLPSPNNDQPYAQNNEQPQQTDALLCSQDFYKKNQHALASIELIIFEGMEGCWTHSNLKPEFFQQTNICMGNVDL